MIIPKFELSQYVNSIHPNINLKNTHVICVQHVVASTISLFNSLFDKGLDPKNLSVIGKCYSTRPEAFNYLKKIGIDIAEESLYFDPYTTFDESFKMHLLEFFSKRFHQLENEGCEKLIILDDGGELLSLTNSLLLKKDFWNEKIFGVEQTTAGYEKLKKLLLKFPVINVARSKIKLHHESPFIARIAVERMLDHLQNLKIYPKRALIIGNGAVGSHFYSEIKDLYHTEIFDLDITKSSINHLDIPTLNTFDLFIGCTGKTVMNSNHFKILKENSCLVSVSSSDREFSGYAFRKNISNIHSCHQDICSNGMHLLNCGFPINFDDEYEALDAPEFQLTRSILQAAIYQSLTTKNNTGLIPLDPEIQEKIFNLYEKLSFNPAQLQFANM